MRYLVVGDVHVKTNNLVHIASLTSFLVGQARSSAPDAVVLLGDLLDYHEKVLTPCLNAAYTLVQALADICPVYILVGNHDYISNTQFLTDAHWMNGMKHWPGVTIVDKVLVTPAATFCPYVAPGRLAEALATCPTYVAGSLLFCHQEFRGCDMGAVRSEHGDADTDARLAVSGHIHDSQWIGRSIYYVGAPMQHAFGDAEKRIIALVDSGTFSITEIPVSIGRKVSLSVTAAELAAVDTHAFPPDASVRLTVCGSVSECQALKKTALYKKLGTRAKIVFRTADATPAPSAAARVLFVDCVRQRLGDTAAARHLFDRLVADCVKTE